MRYLQLLAAMILVAMLALPPMAMAFSDDESKAIFTKLVHSYYGNDAKIFFSICSQFEKPLFDNLKDVRAWMDDRMAPSDTYLKVRGVMVAGVAKITSEKLTKIEFRFDGSDKAPSRIIVVTAWVNRVIEFDDSVPPERRVVNQVAILKIYVTIVKELLVTFKSDEINFGYSFAITGTDLSAH